MPAELSSPKVRLEDWLVSTSPGSGKPVVRQCPLLSTSAGSVSREFGNRMTEPEQLLSETVPARVTAFSWGDGDVSCDRLAVVDVTTSWTTELTVSVSAPLPTLVAVGSAATAGAVLIPAKARMLSAATRGFLMWGSPLATWAAGNLPAARDFVMHIVKRGGLLGKKLCRHGQLTQLDGYLGPLVLPCPRPLPLELPGPPAEAELDEGEGDGEPEAVGRVPEEAPADGLPPVSGPADVSAEVAAPDATAPEAVAPGAAGSAEDAGSLASLFPAETDGVPPFRSCAGPEEEPEEDSPAIRAAADTTPTAPTATTTRRERRTPVPCAARRRAARPAGGGPDGSRSPDSGAAGSIRGSSAVASYTFCQPCAAAGSVYSSYAGAGAGCGWYTFGAPDSYSTGLDMATDCRDLCGRWDSYRR